MLLLLSDYEDEVSETALVEGFLCARYQLLLSVLTHFILTIPLRYVLRTQLNRGNAFQTALKIWVKKKPTKNCLHSLSVPKL